MKGLTCQIITGQLLSQLTWTGKSVRNARKYAMKDYTLICRVIYETVLAADSSYTMYEFDKDFVTKVMKVAFKGDENHEES